MMMENLNKSDCAHNRAFCPLYMICEIRFQQKYDTWKLQLESWNTIDESLNQTLNPSSVFFNILNPLLPSVVFLYHQKSLSVNYS